VIRLIYVAGRFNADTGLARRDHVTHAMRHAAWVLRQFGVQGLYPVVPHAQGEHLVGIGAEHIHYAGTLEIMRRCQAVLVVPGWEASKGTLAEIKEADTLGLPVFFAGQPHTEAEIREWLRPREGDTCSST